MESTEQKKVGVLGFGDLGQRLFRRLQHSHQCIALSRSEKPGPWQWRQTDASNSQSLQQNIADLDYLVVSMVPQERSDEGYRLGYVKPVEDLIELQRAGIRLPFIIFVSSTSTMAQNNGEWADENSPCTPRRYNGKRMLEAEQGLKNSCLDFTIVRFSGIYGPGRTRLIKMVDQTDCKAKAHAWTNRIHADDCAGVLAHLIHIRARGELFIASDHQPVCDAEIKGFIAQCLNKTIDIDTDTPISGKRCSNQKLTASGYQFIYPNYQEAYADLIAAYKKEVL